MKGNTEIGLSTLNGEPSTWALDAALKAVDRKCSFLYRFEVSVCHTSESTFFPVSKLKSELMLPIKNSKA